MHKIHKKEYNALLSSFGSRVFLGTIVVSTLFACTNVSEEALEDFENEIKAEKEETEKVKKELGDKITALENKVATVITPANYTNMQNAVGLDANGNLNTATGLARDVEHLKGFESGVRVSLELDEKGKKLNDSVFPKMAAKLSSSFPTFNTVQQKFTDGINTVKRKFAKNTYS